MLLTIIIPIYKVEKTIEACLDSIFNQGVDEKLFSVLLINDGSPDKSVSLCYPYIQKYENIQLLEQSNQGLSMARNNGLENSCSEYVWFVDSDDTLCKNSINSILNSIQKSKSDCLLLGHEEVDESDKVINLYCYNEDKEMPGVDFLTNHFRNCEFFIPAQFTVWRRDFLRRKKLSFFPSIYHEDCEFSPKAIFLSSSIRCLSGIHYKYIRHDNTISTTICSKRAYDYITVAKSLSMFSVANGNSTVLCNFSALFINSAIKIIMKCSTKEQIKFWNNVKKDSNFIRSLPPKATGKYKITSYLVYYFIKFISWN